MNNKPKRSVMKIKITLVFILYFFSTSIYSQFLVSISSTDPNSCKDSVVQFTALATNGGTPVDSVNFIWSFGNGSPAESGLNLDTIEHTFAKGGGYIVRVDASKGADADYTLLKYEIALTPNFSGTHSDREDPICLGQQIFLSGKINDSTWVYEIPDSNVEENPVLVSDTNPYSSKFDYRIFAKTQTVGTASDIDSIGINLEHTNLSQVKIELSCPGGTTIILKDFGGASGKYFGDPINELGYDYFWTNSPDNGTMNSAVPTGNSLLSGSYTPDQSFNLLTGCPLNGEWLIKVTDNQANDTGFVFSNQLKFEASLLPADWEYSHTYSFPEWLGSGVSSTSGAGLATAVPEVHGNHRYTFQVTDNFNCQQDTSFINNVEAVTFTTAPDPAEGPFNLSVQFTNTTSWATEFLWDFGDETETGTDESAEHIYEKDGLFSALLTASTDDGCSDTLSVLVTVTIPESSLDDIPTAFSPNNDQKNDFFKLKEGTAIETLDCWIYSRWGQKVAEWHSVQEATETGWDGKVNGGREASPGVYFYYIKAIGYDGKEYEKKGSFHLFR